MPCGAKYKNSKLKQATRLQLKILSKKALGFEKLFEKNVPIFFPVYSFFFFFTHLCTSLPLTEATSCFNQTADVWGSKC